MPVQNVIDKFLGVSRLGRWPAVISAFRLLLFTQVYSIHATFMERTLPLVYALLPNKNQATYQTLFAKVRNLTRQNRGIQSVLSEIHPTIWKFINGLRRYQKLKDAEIEGLLAGRNATRKRPAYECLNKRIKNIVLDYQNRVLSLIIYVVWFTMSCTECCH